MVRISLYNFAEKLSPLFRNMIQLNIFTFFNISRKSPHLQACRSFSYVLINRFKKHFRRDIMDQKRLAYITLLIFSVLSAAWFFWHNQQLKLSEKATEPIIFGALLELSGKFAHNGTAANDGIQLALQEINAGGGLLGRPVRLLAVDNRSDENSSIAAFNELAQSKNLVAVIGPVYSNLAIAVSTRANDAKIPFIAIGATNPKVTVDNNGRVHPYAFRICYIDPFQGRVMANFAIKTLKAQSAALFIDDTAAYSKGLASFFEQVFLQNDCRISAKRGYTPETSDFRPALLQLLASRPDVLFVPGFFSETAKIIIQARELGFSGPILGGDGWDEALLIKLAPAAALNNTFYCDHYYHSDNNPRLNDFSQRYRDFTSGHKEITTPAILAYDATMLLADAIKRASSADPVLVRKALEETRSFPALLGNIHFDEHHNPEKDAFIVEIVNGKGQFRQRISPTP